MDKKKLPKKIRRALLHAQLDLVELLDFATTVAKTFNKEAALMTIKELQELTGDPAGTDYFDNPESDICQ